jgi:hypothetical protein
MNFQVTILPADQWRTWIAQQQKTGVSAASTTGDSPVGSTTGSSQ